MCTEIVLIRHWQMVKFVSFHLGWLGKLLIAFGSNNLVIGRTKQLLFEGLLGFRF